MSLTLVKFKILREINRRVNQVEIFLGRKKLISRPRYAQIEPTNRCNQRCIMCPRNDRLDVPIGDMDFKTFKKILDQLPTIQNLLLNGLGEPLLNKELPEMIIYAYSRGIKVSINSNCALVDKSLAEKLVNSGLHLIKISLDSTDPKIYQSIRNGPLEPVIRGIKELVKARRERKSFYPQLWFNSIIMKQNYNQIFAILKLAEELGVDYVRFKPIDTFDVYKDEDLKISNKQLEKILEDVLEKSKTIKIKHNLDDLLKDIKEGTYYRPDKVPCYIPWNEVYVQYYGGVRLCCDFYSKKYDVGNVLEEKFSKIWNNEKMQEIRGHFIKGELIFPVCKSCNHFSRNLEVYNKIAKIKKFYVLQK